MKVSEKELGDKALAKAKGIKDNAIATLRRGAIRNHAHAEWLKELETEFGYSSQRIEIAKSIETAQHQLAAIAYLQNN